MSPVRIIGIVAWITCAYGAFLWASGYERWPGLCLTILFALQMGVQFRQMGSFGWLDAVLYPLHLFFFTFVFVLGIFNVRIFRRVHWRGRTVTMIEKTRTKA